MPIPSSDNQDQGWLLWLFGSVITALMGACSWLFHRAYRSTPNRLSIYTNGDKLDKQGYVKELEASITRYQQIASSVESRMDGLEQNLSRYLEMLLKQQPQIDSLEDLTTSSAQKIRELRETCLRIESSQRQQRAENEFVRDALERIEARIPERGA